MANPRRKAVAAKNTPRARGTRKCPVFTEGRGTTYLNVHDCKSTLVGHIIGCVADTIPPGTSCMTSSSQFTDYVLELLEPVIPVRTGRFFGGVGISRGNVQFAMIMGSSLYLVVDDSTRQKYEDAGMTPFSYTTKKGRIQVRRYFELPEEILTDPDELRTWVRESIEVAGKVKKPIKAVRPARAKKEGAR